MSEAPEAPAPPTDFGWRPPVILPPTAADPAHYDRWAHRRGEPRMFVLLWTTFLFSATLLTLTGVGVGGYVAPDIYRPAARILMVTLMAGVALLWPMIRLSQEAPPRGGFGPSVQDVFIVGFPAQAVIWPQWWLAGWSLPVLAAVTALVAAWASLVGAVLAHALTSLARRPGAARAPWMLVMLALALAGIPAAWLTPPAGLGGNAAWMLSPLSAVHDVVRDRGWSGTPAVVGRVHWAAILWTAGLSVPLWLVAWSRARGLTRAPGLH